MKGKIKFIPQNNTHFFNILRKRVYGYLEENNISPHANAAMVIKTIAMLCMYYVPYALIITGIFTPLQMIPLCIMMGIGMSGIGMSVMHDANHGAYSKNPRVNHIIGYILNLVGGNAFNWKLQHNILHHTYTNITDYDEDINSKLVLRLSPYAKHSKIQNYQKYYIFFLYGIMTIYWAILKDFVQFKRYTANGVNPGTRKENVKQLTILIASKLFYLGFILLPVWLTDITLMQMIVGWLIMEYVSGLILGVTFQLAHEVEGTHFPLPDTAGHIENEWAVHQLCTTANFAPKNRLLSWYVGGLNFQIEHHLFPKICHIHYKKIAPIVKATAEEYGVPYIENPTFLSALSSHVRTIDKLGHKLTFREIMEI